MKKIIAIMFLFINCSIFTEERSGLSYKWSQLEIDTQYYINTCWLGSERANVQWGIDTACLDYEIKIDQASKDFKYLYTYMQLCVVKGCASILSTARSNLMEVDLKRVKLDSGALVYNQINCDF